MSVKPRTRTFTRLLIATFALAGAPSLVFTGTAAAAPAVAKANSCSTSTAHWGSLTKTLNRRTSASITNVRAGRHTCFDRMVVDLRGRGAGYTVQYVSQVLTEGGGAVVPLRGGAKLSVVVKAPTYNVNTGVSTYNPANKSELVNVSGYSTFRQIAFGGSFEGYTTIGLGVRARLPMRAFVLNGPAAGSRVVVDVAHHW
ncbi:MAG: hypothetical protein ABI360_08730 [Allobranchiibius sp.]